VVCREWKLRFQLKKAKSYEEFIEFATDEFNDKLLMLISEKLELLQENPFKYSREKLGKDIYGNTMFSIEVTGDMRILYSVDSKNCIVFIWEVGSHKKVYGR
jgi:mRNA-degrading endonuclease RelE of RelBE toxin-antitoxin system